MRKEKEMEHARDRHFEYVRSLVNDYSSTVDIPCYQDAVEFVKNKIEKLTFADEVFIGKLLNEGEK